MPLGRFHLDEVWFEYYLLGDIIENYCWGRFLGQKSFGSFVL